MKKDDAKSRTELVNELVALRKRVAELEALETRYPPTGADLREGVRGTPPDVTERDVTEQKRMEEALRQSEERYRRLVEMAPDVIFSLSAEDGTVTSLNSAFERLTGWSQNEWLGQPFPPLLHPDDMPLAREKFRQALGGQTVSPFEVRIRCPFGRYLVAEIVGTPHIDDGKIVQIQGIARDVTERHRAEAARRVSEEKFSKAFRSSPDAISISTLADGRYIEVNESFLTLSGYRREEVIGHTALELNLWVNAEDRAELRRRLEAQRAVRNLEYNFRAKAGEPVVGLLSAEIIELEGERCLLAVVKDITHLKRAEKVQASIYKISEAAHSARDLDDLFQSIHDIVSELMPARNFYIALYDEATETLSFPYFVDEQDPMPAAKTPGKGLTEYVLRTGRPLLASPEVFGELVECGEVELIGAPSIDWLGVPLKADEKTIGVLVVQSYTEGVRFREEHRDILMFVSTQVAMAIERKQAEAALRDREARLRLMIEQMPAMLWTTDHDLRITSSLGAGLATLNLKPNELVGVKLVEYLGTDDPAFLPLASHRRALDGESTTYRQEWAGNIYQVHVEPLRGADGRIIGAIGVALDITEHKRAEAALRESEERYRDLVQGLDAIVWEGDPETFHFTFVSQQAEGILGYPIQAWLTDPNFWVEHIHPDDRERTLAYCREATLKGRDHELEYRFVAADGRIVWLQDFVRVVKDAAGRVRQNRGLMIDITERKRMEEELLKAQKLESVGLLAGGIAHDFNNILMGILGNISLAKLYATPGDTMYDRLTAAEKASERARDLTQQLLTFSKGGAPVKTTASIGDLIRDTVEFALRGSRARCEFLVPDDLWPVEVDEGQISQVIQNLIINADQAMPGGGIVQVGVKNVVIGADEDLPLNPGCYVMVAVKDQGVGILKEHLSKIFDPYFTTKQKGSGLGLATAYSIVRRHEGYIMVESEVGVGTTFGLYLPASDREIPIQTAAPEQVMVGRGKVLLMDDEAAIREVASQMLRSIGYEVELARDGAEAAELYQQARHSDRPFDAVILDLTVPGGLGGKETVGRLADMDPQVKAIVSSGYSNDPVMAEFKKYGFSGFVAKPYRIQDLSQTLYRVINGSE